MSETKKFDPRTSFHLDNEVVFITGAAGQLGSTLINALLASNAKIIAADVSDKVLQDDVLARLLTFPNVLISSHQAFLTNEALINIAQTTLENISEFQKTGTVPSARLVIPEGHLK